MRVLFFILHLIYDAEAFFLGGCDVHLLTSWRNGCVLTDRRWHYLAFVWCWFCVQWFAGSTHKAQVTVNSFWQLICLLHTLAESQLIYCGSVWYLHAKCIIRIFLVIFHIHLCFVHVSVCICICVCVWVCLSYKDWNILSKTKLSWLAIQHRNRRICQIYNGEKISRSDTRFGDYQSICYTIFFCVNTLSTKL